MSVIAVFKIWKDISADLTNTIDIFISNLKEDTIIDETELSRIDSDFKCII